MFLSPGVRKLIGSDQLDCNGCQNQDFNVTVVNFFIIE